MGKKSFIIQLASRTTVQCTADFFRIEQGCLWFRNMVAGSQSEFETVIVYAPGEWRTVEEGQ